MERAATLARGGLTATDVPDLMRALDRKGPVVSVYLRVEQTIENPGPHNLLAWRAARTALDEQGAPRSALDAIEAEVPDAHRRGPMLAVIADASGIVLSTALAEPLPRDVLHVGPLAVVTPMLAARQADVAHVVVRIDRSGADVTVVHRGTEESHSIDRDDPHDPVLRRSNPGGWSQRRYQQRAENRWIANADAVAGEVATLAEQAGALLVVVAGDVRATTAFVERFPARLADRVRVIDGTRHAGGDDDAFAHEVARLVHTAAAEATVALVHKLREELGQHDKAVAGPAAVTDALRRAQVDTLLVHDDPTDERMAWVGDSPAVIALDEADLGGIATEHLQRARFVDSAVHAAFVTGAAVRVVPAVSALDEGVAALLRFTTD